MQQKFATIGASFALLLASTGCLPTPEISVPDFSPPPTPPDMATPPPPVCTVPYPPFDQWGREVGTVIDPDLMIYGEKGSESPPISMRSLYAPCQQPAQLILLRLTAPWCGPCLWQAAHTGEIVRSAIGSRVRIIDVLLKNQRNRPAQTGDLTDARKLYDTAPQLAKTDGTERIPRYFAIGVDGELRLPVAVVLNAQNMRILGIYSNPDPDTLMFQLQRFAAEADGLPAPPPPVPNLYDGRFTRDRWEMIQAMQLRSDWQPPADPTNRVEQSAAAAALGRSLFFDVGLTQAGAVGCVTCHSPATAFADGLRTGRGVAPDGTPAVGDRNTPWLGGIAASRFQFWDGRADSLWAQALGPFENDKEISSDRMYVVRTSLARYLTQYETVFGAAPDLRDTGRFPLHGRPGMTAWEQMAPADQRLVSGVYANLGKAIAAYVRGIRPQPVALDRYAAGDMAALSDGEKDGLLRFFEVGCSQCHYGPLLQDDTFHANYFPTGRQDGAGDVGRLAGLMQLLASEFRGDGPFSDAPLKASWLSGLASAPSDEGQFRTSSLRGVADTAPYTHGGMIDTLDDLIDLYAAAGRPDGDLHTLGIRDVALVRFNKTDPRNALLVQFLRTFKAAVTAP